MHNVQLFPHTHLQRYVPNRIVAEEEVPKRDTTFRLVCANLREGHDDNDSVNSDDDESSDDNGENLPSHYLWCLEEAKITVLAKSSDGEGPV